MPSAKNTAAKKKNTTTKKAATSKKATNKVDERQMARDKELIGIAILALGLLLLIGYTLAPDANSASVGAVGAVGLFFLRSMRFFAGNGAVALPVFLLLFGILVCIDRNRADTKARYIGLAILFIGILGFLHLEQDIVAFKQYISAAAGGSGGGIFGSLIDFVLLKAFGRVGTIIILITLIVIGILLALEASLVGVVRSFGLAILSLFHTVAYTKKSHKKQMPANSSIDSGDNYDSQSLRRTPFIINHNDPAPLISEKATVPTSPPPPGNPFSKQYLPEISYSANELENAAYEAMKPNAADMQNDLPADNAFDTLDAGNGDPFTVGQSSNTVDRSIPKKEEKNNDEVIIVRQDEAKMAAEYVLPPVDLVTMGKHLRNPKMNQAINDSIDVLESTLDSFGVKATVTQVVAGPAVTRYELQPAPGVKVSRITSLADDIALTLAAQGVRIEAPIPGKSAIGIEVARKDIDTVYFREMIDSNEFKKKQAKLAFALGKNISGECIVGDLAKMPHLLIAGATGSGKSICVNSIICSILYKAKPNEVKLLLIDPKKVEMTNYNSLPHLLAPVVSDNKKAANSLKWVVNEMENRYSLFVGAGVKDFVGYNKANFDNPLPQIVVIIDELADLMMVAKHDVEEAICRIAQMARAAGIHLVVATQRPSVDVITGLIKANIPSRVAFAVSSYTDSRTILDMGGAEKLMGRGDMLYHPVGSSKPVRVQGSYIEEQDIKRLVKYCTDQSAPCFSEEATAAATSIEKVAERDEDVDELFVEAARLIIGTGQASTSFLQRRLAIGNPRAARIIDVLEMKGIVGGPKGSKPRDVLMTMDEFDEIYS